VKQKKDNPYVHKFTRRYLRNNREENGSGLSPRLKLAGIIMIACIAVPVLLVGLSMLTGFF